MPAAWAVPVDGQVEKICDDKRIHRFFRADSFLRQEQACLLSRTQEVRKAGQSSCRTLRGASAAPTLCYFNVRHLTLADPFSRTC